MKSTWTNLPEGYALRGDHERVSLIAPAGTVLAARPADLDGTLELAELAWVHAWQQIRDEVRAELSAVSGVGLAARTPLKRLSQFVRLLEALSMRPAADRRHTSGRKAHGSPSSAVPTT